MLLFASVDGEPPGLAGRCREVALEIRELFRSSSLANPVLRLDAEDGGGLEGGETGLCSLDTVAGSRLRMSRDSSSSSGSCSHGPYKKQCKEFIDHTIDY